MTSSNLYTDAELRYLLREKDKEIAMLRREFWKLGDCFNKLQSDHFKMIGVDTRPLPKNYGGYEEKKL